MNTTSRFLLGCLATGALALSSVVWTGMPAQAQNPAVGVPSEDANEALENESVEMRRVKVLDLCKRARQAMEAGNWETADSLIRRSEAFQVRWPVMYFGDRPEKVRKDYQKVRGTSAGLPSKQYQANSTTTSTPDAPVAKHNSKTPTDPFAAQAALAAQNEAAPKAPSINDPGSQAKQWLAKGRAELSRGNVTGASHWYQKAAQAQTTWNPNEDTPEKLFVDLRAAGGKAPAAEPIAANPGANARNPVAAGNSPFARPETTTPPAADDQLPPALRRAGANNAPATAQAAQANPMTAPVNPPSAPPVTNLPAVTPASFNAPPVAAAPTTASYPTTNVPATASLPTTATPNDTESRRAQSDGLLWTARRALAVGDVRRATEAVNQAKALAVNYDPREDSPARVEAAVAKFADLAQRPAGERDSEGYRRRYAELQMQQADDLLRLRDFDEAERLATEAKRRGIIYSPFENNPDDLLKRIAEARRGTNSRSIEPLPSPTGAPVTMTPPAAANPTATPAATNELKLRAQNLLQQARVAMAGGDLNQAEALAQEADRLRVPEESLGQRDDRPWLVLMQIQKARQQQATGGVQNVGAVQPASGVMPIAGANAASQAYYDPATDATHNMTVANQQPLTTGASTPAAGPSSSQKIGVALFVQGEEALRRHDPKTAAALFREAATHHDDLDQQMQQRLQDRLQLTAGTAPLPTTQPNEANSLMREAAQGQALKLRQASDELNRKISQAKRLQESDPKQATLVLQQARTEVEKSSVDSSNKEMLLRRVDRVSDELAKYLDANRPRIELDEKNQAVKDEIAREEQAKFDMQDKLAKTIDEFNELMDQRRFAEAELVAKKAFEIAPREPVVMQVMRQAKLVRSNENAKALREEGQDGWVRQMESIQESGIPFDDRQPMQFRDAKEWKQLSETRGAWLARQSKRKTEREIEIEQRLRTPVSMQFKDTPLQEVMRHLSSVTGVNIYLDPRGLAEEAVDSSTPVTISLNSDISLKSALHLVLDPLHLSFIIKDEVLKITSEQMRDGEVYTQTYSVADLVIPIPNFVPNGQMGLAGALADAQRNAGAAGNGQGSMAGTGGPMAVVASSNGGSTNAAVNPEVLAQFGGGIQPMGGMFGRGGATGSPQNIPFASPGGLGGGVQPDFDSLMELITQTIAPQSWTEVGGAGAIKEFPTNLSLVISQTQEVHEQIAELLEQLRRLQDLQVTIEVRFINLSDTFYEKMGINFDINIPSNVPQSTLNNQFTTDANGNLIKTGTFSYSNSITGGMQNLTQPTSTTGGFSPVWTNDLSIPFNQSSFSLTNPNLSQFNLPQSGVLGGASLGFAILSDIETYFFLQAVQSDSRTNIMQAPKVTLFNGQQAFVSDTQQVPFVITVIPVVGDFAAAQQPVIVVLSEGTFLTVQAVVSSDRRFVRLTVVPFFSNISAVNTFTFTGSSSSTRDTSTTGPVGASTSQNNVASATNNGTTVQLPTFAFTTVTTTVSVPDGGTVLLGGIKRLAEQRIENGVPILNKLPYVQRLFNNIGTGRTTTSLMMMVTPRIIIQEEEEAKLGQGSTP
ncbi:MAG: hypothetical protein JSS27_20960 [Planctomycetes bacterium]|nr:hypothetical protein [Planctomycetota bacterium]